MITKIKLLERIDEAIKDYNTSSKTKQLLIDLRDELKVANSKDQKIEIAIKLVELISTASMLYDLFGPD